MHLPLDLSSRSLAARLVLVLCMFVAASGSAAAQDALTKMRAQYTAQTDPVGKAKILAKLGPREIAAVRDLVNDGDDDKALAALKQYGDAVRETTRALAATGVDASRHSSGFKELQISLRASIRRVDDLILSSHQDTRSDFRTVRSDLEDAESALIDALFPAKGSKASEAKKSK